MRSSAADGGDAGALMLKVLFCVRCWVVLHVLGRLRVLFACRLGQKCVTTNGRGTSAEGQVTAVWRRGVWIHLLLREERELAAVPATACSDCFACARRPNKSDEVAFA